MHYLILIVFIVKFWQKKINKSESIYNNCSFLASFGDGEIKNLTKRKEYSNGGY